MLQDIYHVIGLLLAYCLPGLSISYAFFPNGSQLCLLSRITLSVGLSSAFVSFSMVLSEWLFGSFHVLFVVVLQVSIVAASWLRFYLHRKGANQTVKNSFEETPAENSLRKPVFWLFSIAVLFIMFFRFYNALLFPITNWDSLTEFAYLGRLYYIEGHIPTTNGATLGIGSSANYPPFVPSLYAWFYMLSGGVNELLAKAVSPIFSVMTVIVTYTMARDMYKSKDFAVPSIFFLVTVPIFLLVSDECLSDIVATFFSLTSLYFLHRGLTDGSGSTKYVLTAGVLAGIAAFSKYTGLLSLFADVTLILVLRYSQSGKSRLGNRFLRLVKYDKLVIFVAGFLLFGAPWYIRNLIVMGNPVYPLFYSIFGGRGIDEWVMKNSWDAHFALVTAQNNLDLSIPNLVMTYYTVFFRVSPYEILDLGPFLGAFLAIGVVFSIRRKEYPDVFVLVWVFTYLAVWRFAFSTFLRYLSIALPLLAILSARGLVCLLASVRHVFGATGTRRFSISVSRTMLLSLVIALVLFQGFLFPCAVNSVRGYKTWVFVSPYVTREEYLKTRFLGTWDAIEFLNGTPANVTVLTYDHSISYYVERSIVFADEPRAKGLHLAGSDTETLSVLRSLKVSYIVITTTNERYLPLLQVSYFYRHIDNGTFAQLVLDRLPAKVYAVMK